MEQQSGNDPVEVVEHKVKKRVAKKVMRDIHKIVDEILAEEASEHRLTRWFIPLMLLLAAVISLLTFSWTDINRALSGLLG